jgi:hypothetical protein
MIRVRIPSPLYSYTGGRAEIGAAGSTLAELLADVERGHPGFRFRIVDEQNRIRSTILIYVDGAKATSLEVPVKADVMIVAALSGG